MLSKMTLDEKIGQMLELNLDVMGKMTMENAKVDREKVRSVLRQYGAPPKEIEALLKKTDHRSSTGWATIPSTSTRATRSACGN